MAKASETDNTLEDPLVAGVRIFFWLAILTLGEFLMATIAPPWRWALWLAAFWKAFYVVVDYMHIGKLFNDEEAH